MVREADKGGMDADWDRGDTKSLPNLEACEQLCLDSSECMSVHFDEGYCFVFNTPTTTANKAGSIYSMKQCRYTESKCISCNKKRNFMFDQFHTKKI